ncbi:AAA family ATPase [Actinoplanes sp. NPDC026619]|uniref:AAA family ATPase n=1 Tax=Actinoplanes sp. NPDC026619 TaxID=3155798 RepID=UPI0033E8F1BB
MYRGDGVPREVELPPAPPWRVFSQQTDGPVFVPPDGLADAVNVALALRRPLLVTGAPGSGKSSLVDSVAVELTLGAPLRWHITSRSALSEALYRYDVLGRIHAQQLAGTGSEVADIAPFIQLGPLGTALAPANRPRALLIDEIDKSDLDLPSDLLDVLERGEFEIPELARHAEEAVAIQEWGSDRRQTVVNGRIACTEFPFIVMTSNGERDFPAPFLRRCIRFVMPEPNAGTLAEIVAAHLGSQAPIDPPVAALIDSFVSRVSSGESLAVDQLLNAIHLLAGERAPQGAAREQVRRLVLRELSRA